VRGGGRGSTEKGEKKLWIASNLREKVSCRFFCLNGGGKKKKKKNLRKEVIQGKKGNTGKRQSENSGSQKKIRCSEKRTGRGERKKMRRLQVYVGHGLGEEKGKLGSRP